MKGFQGDRSREPLRLEWIGGDESSADQDHESSGRTSCIKLMDDGSPNPTAAAICEAIGRRRLLDVTYHGSARLVEPYAHGVSPAGREMLVGFQRMGGSASGQGLGWKAFRVDEIEELRVLGIPFVVNRPGYREGGHSKNLSEVHCCVSETPGRGPPDRHTPLA